MKRLILTLIALALVCVSRGYCQTLETVAVPDSLVAAGEYNVFDHLSDSVTIHQSPAVAEAMSRHIQENARRTSLGIADQTYSIRIFSDNSQNARGQWDAVAGRFKDHFPGVPVSKTFEAPFFKVTVGDYSTKADANAALKRFQTEFPSAFIVRN